MKLTIIQKIVASILSVKLDGIKICNLWPSEQKSFEVLDQQHKLTVEPIGEKFDLLLPHKSKKEIIIHNEDSKNREVECTISATTNILGHLSFGLLTNYTNIDISVTYK